MSSASIEISVKGQPVSAAAASIQGRSVIVTGRLIRHAVVHDEEWLEGTVVPDPATFVQALRERRPKIDLFSFAEAQPDFETRHPYHFEWDNVAVVRTESYEAWWSALSQDARRNVRLAEKRGMKIREIPFDDQLVAGIKGIYDETPIRQGRKFWHYGKSMDRVRAENSTYVERSKFIGAFLGEELVGFIKIVFVGKTARIMQILSMNKHFDKRPANGMIAKAVEIAAREKMSFLAYCRYTYGNKRGSSITEFKRRNGFIEIRFPRYYIPLTLRGKMVLRTGLHLGAKNLLPEPVTNFLLNVRSKFYERTIKGETNSPDGQRNDAPNAASPNLQ